MGCSKELDVLIFDSHSHTPYFNQNGLAIVTPSSTIAHIEVKSTFKKTFIKDAITNLISARSISKRFTHSHDLWSGICIFHVPESRTLNSIAKSIADSIVEKANDTQVLEQYLVNSVSLKDVIPTCIFSIDKFIAFVRIDEDSSEIHVKVFEPGELSSALVFSDLFSRIRTIFGGHASDDISDILLDICEDGVSYKTYSRLLY